MAAVTFTPVSDHALMVQLGDEISDALTARVQQLDSAIHAAAPQGLLETVPAFVNLMITFDPVVADHAEMEQAVRALLQEGAAALLVDVAGPARLVVEGIDLEGLARGWRLARVGDQVAWVRDGSRRAPG